MFVQKSTFVSMVRCIAIVVLFLSGIGSSDAQTPRPPAEKSSEEPVAPTRVEAIATEVAPVVTTDEAKTSVKAEESPKTETQPGVAQPPAMQAQCKRTLKADVVALAQPIFLNRLGTVMPGGMVFALRRDTVNSAGLQLRADKRARPLVLRANVGDCIQITLTNNIPAANFKITQPLPPSPGEPYQTPEVSLHVQGMEWVTGPQDDGSFVGQK